MRILVLTYEFPPVGGGGGRVALDLCSALASRGHQVKVITSHFKGLSRRESQNSFEVVRIPCGRRLAYKATPFDMLAYIGMGFFAGLRLMLRWRPEIIHVHFAVPSGPLAWLLGSIFKIPYVLTAHLGDVPGGVPEKTARMFRVIYPFTPPIWKKAASVVAVSQFTRQLALEHYPVPIAVIPNGVDLSALNPGEIAIHHPPHIVFAGRFMPQKNPLALVNILSHLTDLPWQCTMAGDGPLLPAVKQAIQEHHLETRIHLPGWITPDEVIALFSKGDLLFMPSLSEGFPIAGVQALGMGLAIVASQVGGFVDLVQQGENGMLHYPEQIQAMEQSLRQILSDPELLLRMRRHSRELAGQFDLAKIVDRYEDVFTQAAARPSRHTSQPAAR